MDLQEFFKKYPKVAVACSGGVDSAFLLCQAKLYAKEITAYFVKSAFQPEFEKEDAQKLCSRLSIKLKIIETDVLSDEKITENLPDRCYYCKKKIFGAIKRSAEEDGYEIVLEGTNASDDIGDRPGVKALQEYGVRSPLRECGYTKQEIRKGAKEAGLFVHDKPAYACLATRIPCQEKITKELLWKVEKAEGVLFEMGFSDFRVRLYHEAARIQLRESEIKAFLLKKKEITEKLSPFFEEVFLDCRISR